LVRRAPHVEPDDNLRLGNCGLRIAECGFIVDSIVINPQLANCGFIADSIVNQSAIRNPQCQALNL
jgi:hypothetical protein